MSPMRLKICRVAIGSAALLPIACTSAVAWQPPPPAEVTTRDQPELEIKEQRPISDFFTENERGDLTGSISVDLAFETGSYELRQSYIETLVNDVAQNLKEAYVGPVCVEGFADGVGATDRNQALSLNRAESVANVLTLAGVEQVETIGWGEQFAEDDVDDPTQRRVDITLVACRQED